MKMARIAALPGGIGPVQNASVASIYQSRTVSETDGRTGSGVWRVFRPPYSHDILKRSLRGLRPASSVRRIPRSCTIE